MSELKWVLGARLVVRGLPDMTLKEREKVSTWLRKQAFSIEGTDAYAAVYTARISLPGGHK